LARGGAPAGEVAFLTQPMTEPQLRAGLEGITVSSLFRVLE
jgi:homoserine dehydrogenase